METTATKLQAFATANNITKMLRTIGSTNDYAYAYAKTKKEVIVKYHTKFDNFSLQVSGVEKSIIDINQDGTRNKMFDEIIKQLQTATPHEKNVEEMVTELDLF